MNNPTETAVLNSVIRSAPSTLDLTDEQHLSQAKDAADQLLAAYRTREALERLENDLAAAKDDYPLFVHLAVKLAKSKKIISDIPDPVHVSVVFAVYQEHIRILTTEENPLGENFLIRKIAQMQWLFADYPNFPWDMIVVDDGCPDHSGEIAQRILAEKYGGDNVEVLFLQDAIDQNLPVIRPMTSTNDSHKGGSVEYGMWVAAQQEHPNHIILFTDADLSTHLGQTGLLVDGIVNAGGDAAIGSRREPTSVVVKASKRNVRGKLFIYLWKRIITNLNYIVDTQCGFKAFTADTVRAIDHDLIEKQFAFDIELLLKTELRRPHAIVKTPIAWIDSEALSTTTDIQPYLSMLKKMVQMYHKYLPPNPESDAFAAFIDSLDEASWERLVDNVPAAIADREPSEFGTYNQVQVSDLMSSMS